MREFFIHTAQAHENYVLTHAQIDAGMQDWSYNILDALKNPVNLRISLLVGVGSAILIILYFLFQHSKFGRNVDAVIQKAEPLADVILRVALGASFIASAYFSAYLGPEIAGSSIPVFGAVALQITLYALGFMLILGLLTRFVGAVSMLIFLLATIVYKDYILTYFNYFGEFLAMIWFGSFVFSLDKLIFKNRGPQNKNLEIALIRITYGLSILYPAISIKLLHPIIIVQIVNEYHLNQFHWLFPSDPLLIALGTGLAQVAVGIAIALGFQTRLNTLVTFVLMAMSVLFFKEAVWPHIILLALALYLMINNGGKYSLDYKIDDWLDKRRGIAS